MTAIYDAIDFQDTAGDATCEPIVEALLFNEAKSVSPRSKDVSLLSSSTRSNDAVKPVSPRGKSVSPRANDGGMVSPRANVGNVAKAKSPRANELKSLSPRAGDSYTVSPRAIEVTTVTPRGTVGGSVSSTVTPRMGGPACALPSLESPTPYSPDRDHDNHWPPLSVRREEESAAVSIHPQKSQSEIDREDTQQRLQQLEYMVSCVAHPSIHLDEMLQTVLSLVDSESSLHRTAHTAGTSHHTRCCQQRGEGSTAIPSGLPGDGYSRAGRCRQAVPAETVGGSS